ncbi:hypothetical protein EZS27_022024 [termite gut metagenome]|uniref:Uncharacterized protein n=1 Tax=termite gut metagenome TaxID=433724 RepID=A0A5J4R4Q1_9ZZZZ
MFLGELQRNYICIEMSEYDALFDPAGVGYCLYLFLYIYESFGFFFDLTPFA